MSATNSPACFNERERKVDLERRRRGEKGREEMETCFNFQAFRAGFSRSAKLDDTLSSQFLDFFFKGEDRGSGQRVRAFVRSRPSLYAGTLTLRVGSGQKLKIIVQALILSGRVGPRPIDQVYM